jgi:arylsulfatase A-like enzyme
MNRRTFLGAVASSALGNAGQPRRPNIVLVLADNLGYGVLGCYGQPQLLTPNLDRMAGEGIRFTQAYVGGIVCTPSRCALMTGLHTGHARLRGNKAEISGGRFRGGEVALETDDFTVAEVLKRAGYATGICGKWGMGGAGTTGHPNDQGFDEWFGYLDQLHAHNFYPQHLLENRREVFLLGNLGGSKKEYSHDLFTERGLEFVRRRRDRPFFLTLAYVVPAMDNELYRHTGIGVEVPDHGPYADKPWTKQQKGFAAMVARLDRDVGRLLALLKELDLDQDTIVLFTSDNGPLREAGHDPSFFGDSGRLRGVIRDLYEGGIRVPLIVRWPARIKPEQVSDHICAHWDFLPTAAEIAGVEPPPGLDGISFLPALLGRPQRQHEHLYWEFHEQGFSQAVRMGDWKGVRLRARSRPIELYNLRSDPGEERDIAGQLPEIVSTIAGIMRTARTESPLFPIREAK